MLLVPPSLWLGPGEGRQEGVRGQGPAFSLLRGQMLRLINFPTPGIASVNGTSPPPWPRVLTLGFSLAL